MVVDRLDRHVQVLGGFPVRQALADGEADTPFTGRECGEQIASGFDEIVRYTTIGPVKAEWMVKGKSGWLPHGGGPTGVRDDARS